MSRTVCRVAVSAALCAVLAAAPVRAHEAGDRAMGTVQSVTPDRIVLRASDGHALAFKLTPETRFTRGEKPARAEDVRVGERAVVHGKRGDEGVEAVQVKLAAAKPK